MEPPGLPPVGRHESQPSENVFVIFVPNVGQAGLLPVGRHVAQRSREETSFVIWDPQRGDDCNVQTAVGRPEAQTRLSTVTQHMEPADLSTVGRQGVATYFVILSLKRASRTSEIFN